MRELDLKLYLAKKFEGFVQNEREWKVFSDSQVQSYDCFFRQEQQVGV
jgi:hypothetical protein